MLAGLFVVLTVLILVGTVANRTPVLHRLPVVGAPRLRGRLEVDGRDDLLIRLPVGIKGYAQLEVGLHVRDKVDIPKAVISVFVPSGVGIERSDHSGSTMKAWRGELMPGYGETLVRPDGSETRSRYWVTTETLSGATSELLYFRLVVPEPHAYPIRVKVEAASLYEPYVLDGMVRAEWRADSTPHDDFGDLIREAEELSREGLIATLHGNRDALEAQFYLRAHSGVPDDYPEGTDMLNAAADPSFQGSSSHDALEELVVALYEIRRELGHRQSPRGR